MQCGRKWEERLNCHKYTNIPFINGQSVATGSRDDLVDDADGKQHNNKQAAPNKQKLGAVAIHD